MVDDTKEKSWKSFDPEQYWAPVSQRPWHILLIPLFLVWLVVWMAATFIAGILWLAREIMQGILVARERLRIGAGARNPWESRR